MRTLAAILVIALPAGWAAFAATSSGTDAKTAPKKTATKKTTSSKAPVGKSTTAKTTTTKTGTSKTGTTAKTNTKQRASTPAHRSMQQQPAPDRYKEIQQALVDKGYFAGPVDGNWGPSSLDALKRFQHDQSLIEDGKLGSLSLIALGLGPKRGGTSVLAAPAHQPEPVPDLPADLPAPDSPAFDRQPSDPQ